MQAIRIASDQHCTHCQRLIPMYAVALLLARFRRSTLLKPTGPGSIRCGLRTMARMFRPLPRTMAAAVTPAPLGLW